MDSHLTGDVFGVSRDIPVSYVERQHVDDKLLENITRNKHIIIFGSSKQGKTCLRRHCLRDDDYVLVQCQNTWDIAKLCESILKSAGYEVEISSTKTIEGKSKLSVKAKGGFKLFGVGTDLEGGTEGEQGKKIETHLEPMELDASDPNDLVRALKGTGFNKLIVLEDFHYLPQEAQEQFSFALKTVHEASRITFIIVAVWREENRLIVYNGDLAGRVISVDADAWTPADLGKVIEAGEALLNVEFPLAFKANLIVDSLGSVYVVQESCYKACKMYGVHSTGSKLFQFPETLDARQLVGEVIQEQSARYAAFITNFAAGFGETQLEMYKWLLYPVLTSSVDDLASGLTYRQIRTRIEERHPQGTSLNPGNLTQALQSVPALQAKKNIKPFVLDYDRSNLRLSVVDKGFLIWLAAQDRKSLLEMVGLPSSDQNDQAELGI